MGLPLSKTLEAIERYVLNGISYEQLADDLGLSKSGLWYIVQRVGKKIRNPFKVFKPNVSDVIVADETGTRINGRRRYIWYSICPEKKIALDNRVTFSRTDIDAYFLMQKSIENSRKLFNFFISDGLPNYQSALKMIGNKYGRAVKTIYINREPKGKNVSEELLRNHIIISHEDDCLVYVYKGNEEIERTYASSPQKLAEIINRCLKMSKTLTIYTHEYNILKPFNEFLHSLQEQVKDEKCIHHIICGKDYFKAYMESFLKFVKRRERWFDKNFRNIFSAKNFVKLYTLAYNLFKKHGSLKRTPFQMGGIKPYRNITYWNRLLVMQ